MSTTAPNPAPQVNEDLRLFAQQGPEHPAATSDQLTDRQLEELDALFDELQLYPTVLNDAVTDTHLETSAALTSAPAAAVNAAGPHAQLRYLAQQWGIAEVATHLRDLAALEAV